MMMFGKHPRHPLDLQTETQKFRAQDEQLAAAVDMRHTAKEMIRKRFEIINSQKEPKYARNVKYVSFKEGDQVLVWDDNIPKGIARKLHPRWIGPFTILDRVSAYVYEIMYKGKKKVVHARRLIEYQQYLLEDWKGPEEEKEEIKLSGSSKNPEKEEHAGTTVLRDPEDGQPDEMIDLDPPEITGLSRKEAKEAGLKIGRFYFLKLKKELLLVKLVSTDPFCIQFYRSIESPSATREFLPVWWNDPKDREDWSAQDRKSLPAGFEPMTRKVKPEHLLGIKRFMLVKRTKHEFYGGEIPARPYREAKEWLQKKGKFFQGVGGRDHTLLRAEILSGGKRLKKSKKRDKKGRDKNKIATGKYRNKTELKKEQRTKEKGTPQKLPRRSKRNKRAEWKPIRTLTEPGEKRKASAGRKRTKPRERELQQEPWRRPKKKTKRSILIVEPVRVQTRLSAIMEKAKTVNSARLSRYQDEGGE